MRSLQQVVIALRSVLEMTALSALLLMLYNKDIRHMMERILSTQKHYMLLGFFTSRDNALKSIKAEPDMYRLVKPDSSLLLA